MSQNIVFIPYIKREKDITQTSGIGKPRHHQGYEYGISSWKKWCKKNNCKLIVLDQLLLPEEEMLITWQRWKVLDILEHNQIDYDQVLVVDADSIVHPDCPNFFELTNHNFTSIRGQGCHEFLGRGIKSYSNLFFNKDWSIKIFECFQTGFVIINKSHKEFFDRVFDFYNKHKDEIRKSYETVRTGSDIILLNVLRGEFEQEIRYLPRQFSVEALFTKNLLKVYPQQWWEDSLENLYNSGWIYQFNSIPSTPDRDRTYWMQRIYTELWEKIK